LRKFHISNKIKIEGMGGLLMAKQHDQQFKEEAVKYYLDHKELGLRGCAENLGIGCSTLGKWLIDYKTNDGTIPTRGSGNYASDIEKENARLLRELRDTKDALDVLKKAIGILGK
jgi:transposase